MMYKTQKRLKICMLIAILALSLAGCGTARKEADIQKKIEEAKMSSPVEIMPKEEIKEEVKPAEEKKEEVKPAEQKKEEVKPVTDNKNPEELVKLDPMTDSTALHAEDDAEILLFEGNIDYYNVEIKDNPEATEKINAFLNQNYEDWKSECEAQKGLAQDDYDYHVETEWEWYGYYSEDISIYVEVNNGKLLGFEVGESNYMGGAHPSYYISSRIFDIATGERIFLDDIATDVEALRNAIADHIINQINNEGGGEDEVSSEWLYEDYEDVIRSDFGEGYPVWVPYEDKLMITYNQYEIAPYAAGVLEFDIPWEDIKQYVKPEFLAKLK